MVENFDRVFSSLLLADVCSSLQLLLLILRFKSSETNIIVVAILWQWPYVWYLTYFAHRSSLILKWDQYYLNIFQNFLKLPDWKCDDDDDFALIFERAQRLIQLSPEIWGWSRNVFLLGQRTEAAWWNRVAKDSFPEAALTLSWATYSAFLNLFPRL